MAGVCLFDPLEPVEFDFTDAPVAGEDDVNMIASAAAGDSTSQVVAGDTTSQVVAGGLIDHVNDSAQAEAGDVTDEIQVL